MRYEILYDFAKVRPINLEVFMPLLFVVIGIGIIFYAIKNKKSSKNLKIYQISFGIIASLFSLIISILVIPSYFSNYYETKKVYENKEYLIVEGKIENFTPMPLYGHGHESFSINQIWFDYSDADLTYHGFKNTQSHGGPIKAGKVFRISYFNNGKKNIILKIEANQNLK